MTRLNQILAVEKGTATRAERALTDAYHAVQRPNVLAGLTRTYRPLVEGDPETFPDESNPVQVRVDQLLVDVALQLAQLFDIVATKDVANTDAVADILVGEQIILPNVPVTYLLFLEKQLANLRTFFTALPKLPPTEQWTWDEGQGVWRTPPVDKIRTKKVPKNHVKAPATDKHPAQVDVYHEDVPVGRWTGVMFSGALQPTRVRELIARVDALINAVKRAREEANTRQVEPVQYSEAILDFLFR